MTPELCGSFTFWHPAEKIRRTWYVWAVLDETGKLDYIYLGVSCLLSTTIGPLQRNQCTEPLHLRAWLCAEANLTHVTWSAPADDSTVVDLFDNGN